MYAAIGYRGHHRAEDGQPGPGGNDPGTAACKGCGGDAGGGGRKAAGQYPQPCGDGHTRRIPAEEAPKASNGIVVEGLDNCLVKFAKCCTPVPGIPLSGSSPGATACRSTGRTAPTPPRGKAEGEPGRWIRVSWAEEEQTTYQTALEVSAKDRDGLALDVASALSRGQGAGGELQRQGNSGRIRHGEHQAVREGRGRAEHGHEQAERHFRRHDGQADHRITEKTKKELTGFRAVVTRVKGASVTIDGKVNGAIDHGFLVLLGVGPEDTEASAVKMADKVCGLRVFEDENEKMNLNLAAVGGQLLVVSQFTLYADTRSRRPGFPAQPSRSRPFRCTRDSWRSAADWASGWSTANSAPTCRCTRKMTAR